VSEPSPTRSGTDAGLVAVGLAMAGSGLWWVSACGSAWVWGRRLPRWRPLAGWLVFAHPGRPSVAWMSPVGPVWLYWSVAALVVGAAATVGWGVWRLWRALPGGTGGPTGPEGLQLRAGMAARAAVRAAAGSRALLARADRLRPSVVRPRPADVGFRLGSSRGVGCWASVEDSMLVVGPPRSGKGLHLAVPMILDAPGAVVTTSTRPDNLALTLAERSGRGPVMVFDPEGLAGPLPAGMTQLRWPLWRGCEAPGVAIARAELLVGDGSGSGVENSSFWRNQAVAVTRCLLHAAALAGAGPDVLYRWSHTAGHARAALEVLGGHPGASPGWDTALDAVISHDPRTRDSIWSMVANAFALLADPQVRTTLDPAAGKAADPTALIALGGTVYLLGTASGAGRSTSRLVAALVEDLVGAGRHLAARSPGQRLDPPLTMVLDEAANYPLECLPSLMAEGGGSGIATVTVLQSLAQARDRWGREAAQAIWDAAIVKVILGGSANAEDLADLSRMLGERAEQEWSRTLHPHQPGASLSSSTRWRPVVEVAQLRALPFGQALLILRAAPPILLRLSPWTARRDHHRLEAGRAAWEQAAVGA